MRGITCEGLRRGGGNLIALDSFIAQGMHPIVLVTATFELALITRGYAWYCAHYQLAAMMTLITIDGDAAVNKLAEIRAFQAQDKTGKCAMAAES